MQSTRQVLFVSCPYYIGFQCVLIIFCNSTSVILINNFMWNVCYKYWYSPLRASRWVWWRSLIHSRSWVTWRSPSWRCCRPQGICCSRNTGCKVWEQAVISMYVLLLHSSSVGDALTGSLWERLHHYAWTVYHPISHTSLLLYYYLYTVHDIYTQGQASCASASCRWTCTG